MEDREVIELEFEAEDYWGLPCMCCCYEHSVVGKGVDELGHFFVCERCLEDHEQIDAKLEQQAVELEKHAADFVKQAARLRNLKGRIKAPTDADWKALEVEIEAEFIDLARLEREEGLPTEPPEADAEYDDLAVPTAAA